MADRNDSYGGAVSYACGARAWMRCGSAILSCQVCVRRHGKNRTYCQDLKHSTMLLLQHAAENLCTISNESY